MPAEPGTVSALLRRQSHDRTEHRLLVCDDERLSYGEADRLSARLAIGLLKLGAAKGTHVGLLYPNGRQFVVAALAAARLGAVVVPFSTFSSASELHTQLLDSDVEILLAAENFRSHDYRKRVAAALGIDTSLFDSAAPLFLPGMPVLRHVVFDADQLGDAPEHAVDLSTIEAAVDSADPLAIVYTSGSTGAPKGAVHTHGGLLEHQANLNQIRGLTESDRLFCNSPFFWIGGFAFGLLATLTAGATLVCSNATDAEAALDLLESQHPTMGNGFAAAITHLATSPDFASRDLSSLRRGNLYPLMPARYRPADTALRHNMFGMTEAGSVVLLDGDESDQPECRRGSYGRPAPGFETKIVDVATGAAIPTGSVGELCLRGRYLMQRYYGRSREECFDADGWFHTGDLFRVDADGYFYFVGRAGAMIKTAGANVTPDEVSRALTEALRAMGIDAESYVLGLPDPVRDQIVAAVVAVPDPAAVDEDTVREALRSKLSAYKVPRRYVWCRPADIPMLASGKVDHPALTRMFDD